MNRLIIISTLLISGIWRSMNASGYPNSDAFMSHIDSLLVHKNYFDAREYYQVHIKVLSPYHQLMAGARINNIFNRTRESEEQIDALFQKFSKLLSDSVKGELLQIQLINQVRQGEYAKALRTNEHILSNYSTFIKPEDAEDFKNTRIIWKMLKDQPKQQVFIKADTHLPIYRDNARLANLNIACGNDTAHFIFDTGANISVVTRSMADRLNMVLMDSTFDVTSFTGIKVKSKIAVCPLFSLGNIDIKNAYFLVFPDSSLAVPQINLQINGILGFPVIEALHEIQISRNDHFYVPSKPSKFNDANLALVFLTPVLHLKGGSYFFDTGAQTTTLFGSYYKKHQKEIDSTYSETDIKIGSAGGFITKKGFLIAFEGRIGNKNFKMNEIQLLKEDLRNENEDMFGNLGQDLIKQFDKLTINFENMFVKFD